MAKELEKELIQLVLDLDETEKKALLQMLKAFLKGPLKRTAGTGTKLYKEEADKAISKVEEGEIIYYTANQVDRLIKEIKQLPAKQLAKLKAEINNSAHKKTGREAFRAFLLQGPVFTPKQIALIKKTRKDIDKWGRN